MLSESSTTRIWLARLPPGQPAAQPRGVQQRPGDQKKQQHDRQRAQQQQQQLLQPHPSPIALDREFQIAHRRPVDAAKLAAKEQVDDQRDRGQAQAPQQRRIQKTETVHRLFPEPQMFATARGRAGNSSIAVARFSSVRSSKWSTPRCRKPCATSARNVSIAALIGLAKGPRLGEQLFASFDVVKQHQVVERQLQLVASRECAAPGFRGRDIAAGPARRRTRSRSVSKSEMIDHHAALLDLVGQRVAARRPAAVSRSGRASSKRADNLRPTGPAWPQAAKTDAARASNSARPDRVLLADQQRGQRRGHAWRRSRICSSRPEPVAHRGAGVHDQRRPQVAFFFVLLDVMAIGAAEDPPIEPAQVVARRVLAVFGELDVEAVERAAVQAGDRPFDHLAARAASSRRSGPGFQDRSTWATWPSIRFRVRCVRECRRSSAADDRVGSLALGLGGVGRHQPMPQHGLGHGADVVDRGRVRPAERGPGLGGQHQRLAGARPGAPGDPLADIRPARSPPARVARTRRHGVVERWSEIGTRRTSSCNGRNFVDRRARASTCSPSAPVVRR